MNVSASSPPPVFPPQTSSPTFISPRSPRPATSEPHPPPTPSAMPDDADDSDAMVMSAILPSQESASQGTQDASAAAAGPPANPSTLDGRASRDSLSSGWEEDDDDDAMDMTPDPPPHPPLSAAAAAAAAAADAAAAAALVASASNNNSVSSIATNPYPAPQYETTQPPPPPPATSSVGPSAANDTSEDSTSDDDYDEEYDDDLWHEIAEDHSAPEEDELKSIKDETSALDHAYFESKLIQSFEDPEYAVADTGRIEWTIDHFNGTRENPNKELLMKSPIVTIGGYEWQIKFYPRGNGGTDHVGVYIECLNFVGEECANGKPEPRARSSRRKSSISAQKPPVDASKIKPPPVEYQSTPLQMLDPTPIPRRPGVTADVIIVLYNPTEPRVHVSKSCRHRYCENSTDWGWNRYHGPWFEIGHRLVGQRQALLRDDKLAFTAYIRTVHDVTGCLWEHPNKDTNPWDCFNMTGMQGVAMEHITTSPYVPAVASWLLLKPFREILYSVSPPDAFNKQHAKPKPLIAAFQRVLFDLRVLKTTKSTKDWRPPVSLKPILQAINEIGLSSIMHRCDVVEMWGIMRYCLEKELADTPHAESMKKLFGSQRDRSTNKPVTRLPIKGVFSVQNAIDSCPGFMDGEDPVILQIELERQHFETSTRTWKKLAKNIKLDDHITLHDRSYTLYGYIGHRGDLKSSNFCAVLRPNGPRRGWFVFNDRRVNSVQEVDRVLFRIPESMAKDGNLLFSHLDRNDGVDKCTSIDNTPVAAYVALYLRDDNISALDASKEPAWDPPNWIRQTVLIKREMESQFNAPSLVVELPSSVETAAKEGDKFEIHVRAINSNAFRDHTGSGMVDIRNVHQLRSKGHLISFTIDGRANAAEVRKEIASLQGDIKDPKQIKFWPIDNIIADKWITLNRYSTSEPRPFNNIPRSLRAKVVQRWLWYHVEETIPKTKPKVAETENTPKSNGASSSPAAAESSNAAQSSTADPPAEDTIMSEGEEDDRAPIPPPQRSVPQQRALSPHASDAPSESNAFRRGFPPGQPLAAPITLPPGIPPPPPAGLLMDSIMPSSSSLFGSIPPPPASAAGESNSIPPPAVLPPPATVPLPTSSRGLPPGPQKPPSNRDLYFFLKSWHPDHQQLRPIGFFFTKSASRLDHAILKILPKNTTTKLFRQITNAFVEKVKHRKTFEDLHMQNGNVIIISEPSTMDANTLLEKGYFQEVQDYLEAASMDLCWPHQATSPAMTHDMFGRERYEGPVLAHRPHGECGSMHYLNGDRYQGALALGQRHGRGSMHFANGDVYEGEWARDAQEGRGRYVDGATQNVYEGGWRENRRRGEGVTHWKRAEEGEKMCRVCWEEPAEAAFYDCGHVVACVGCARRVEVCPVCRKKVLSALKLFFVA